MLLDCFFNYNEFNLCNIKCQSINICSSTFLFLCYKGLLDNLIERLLELFCCVKTAGIQIRLPSNFLWGNSHVYPTCQQVRTRAQAECSSGYLHKQPNSIRWCQCQPMLICWIHTRFVGVRTALSKVESWHLPFQSLKTTGGASPAAFGEHLISTY